MTRVKEMKSDTCARVLVSGDTPVLSILDTQWLLM